MRSFLLVLWSGTLMLASCAGHQKELEQSYGNLAARESTLTRPIGGVPLMRTYRNPKFAGVRFAAVAVQRPEIVEAGFTDRDYVSFLENLRGALLDGTARALAGAGRFGQVLPPDSTSPGAGTAVCRTETLPHVTPSANAVARDPVFGEIQPRVIVVFTLTDAASGEIVLKYTEWAVSQWEYGPWAMEELVAETLGITNHFGEELKLY